jgi:cell division protein FtsW
MAIVLLFGLFIWQGMRISFNSDDTFGRILSFGIVSMIALEAIINIGVTSGAFPTKGLPLPFVSYGGTSLIFHMTAVGLLLNVAKRCEVSRR